ncbi:MAG TPA: tripartite tricarboxylate transporter substrate binding protein [Burkholderiales bacterium]|nr:tripartite tricarboxylate transporter substrate binding protein [Burkholderiales bacterium]
MRAVTASRVALYSIAVAVWMCSAAVLAQQNFPTKPVRYVVPFPGGSGNDMVGRLVTDQLSKMWKQQVIVDNRGGASGTIGAAMVAKAPPDGYTLLHCNIAPNAISLSLMPRLPYEHKDFAPITRIGMPPNIIMVHPSTPFRSIRDLVAYAKAHPGKLSYAAGLVGTSPHLTMEWLKQRLRFEIVHVPFVNPSQAMGQVIGGELPIYITNMPLVIGPIQGGRLRALAVASAQRQALLPDVPTMRESGVPDFEVNSWYGVCAPAGVPEALLDRLNADVHAAMRVPEVEHRLTELGMPPAPTTRQEFDAFMRKEIARWAQVIRDAKIPTH